MTTERFTVTEAADVLWPYLRKAKSGKGQQHRRHTAWGSKTKLGLALTIKRLGAGLVIDDDVELAIANAVKRATP